MSALVLGSASVQIAFLFASAVGLIRETLTWWAAGWLVLVAAVATGLLMAEREER